MSKLANYIDPVVTSGQTQLAAQLHESKVEMTLDGLDQVFTDVSMPPEKILASLARISERVEEYLVYVREQIGAPHGYHRAVRR
jgi:hypothetical protein